MQPTRLATNTRKPITGEDAQIAIKEGVELAYDVAKAAFGPRSGNVAIESQYGDPIISHDGVFNLDHLHVPDPGVNMAVRIIVQASRSTNVHVGDGTTGAVVLARSVYTEALALLASTTESRMSIARRIQAAGAEVVKYIDTLKIEATPELLTAVSVISSSDEAVGNLVADTIQEIGADGGVIIENFGGSGIYNDIVSGFYFRRGFTNAALLTDPSNLESRFDKVFVLVCEKELSNVGDIAPILDKCIGKGVHELVLIGNVQTEALAMAVKARLDGAITCTVVDGPDYGAMRTLFMDDVALYTGAKVLSGGSNPQDFTVDMLGAAKVVINEFSTTLVNAERDEAQEAALQARIDELTDELRVAQSPIEQEVVRTRLGRLSGRIAILRVGGNTEVEQSEVKLRVEDAVAALQAAIKDGVVPGGGTVLARLPDTIPFKTAFEQPFRALLENAGRNVEKGLWHVQEAKEWQGYDLRSDKEKLINLKTAGVVDPTMVVKEIVGNACSVAAELIKTTVLLPFDNREAKRG
jgi:chaperonin GroEL